MRIGVGTPADLHAIEYAKKAIVFMVCSTLTYDFSLLLFWPLEGAFWSFPRHLVLRDSLERLQKFRKARIFRNKGDLP